MGEQPATPPLPTGQEEKVPAVGTSSRKSYFIAAGVVLIVLTICIAIYFLTDTSSPKNQPVSNLVLPNTTLVPSQTPTPTVFLKREYSNPFDEKSQYTNPFSKTDTYSNPFDSTQ